jgi:hypothetical protein
LHTERAGGREVLLRVPGIAVTRFGREPPIEVIAIGWEETARIRCVLVDPVPARVFCKEICPLEANFLPGPSLSWRSAGLQEPLPLKASDSSFLFAAVLDFASKRKNQFDQPHFPANLLSRWDAAITDSIQ